MPTRIKNLRRKMPRRKRYRNYPAVKIGRLAVAASHHKRGIGRLLLNTLIGWFTLGNKTGCRYMTVDALRGATDFYKHSGFEFLVDGDKNEETRIMFLDLYPYAQQLNQ